VRTEIDHVVPRGRGGPSTVSNCRILCKLCRVRHNLHYSDWGIIPRAEWIPAQAWTERGHDAA